MDGAPKVGCTDSITVRGLATAAADRPMADVIAAVVLGLITRIFMPVVRASRGPAIPHQFGESRLAYSLRDSAE